LRVQPTVLNLGWWQNVQKVKNHMQ
jgi:hypothetical protein